MEKGNEVKRKGGEEEEKGGEADGREKGDWTISATSTSGSTGSNRSASPTSTLGSRGTSRVSDDCFGKARENKQNEE